MNPASEEQKNYIRDRWAVMSGERYLRPAEKETSCESFVEQLTDVRARNMIITFKSERVARERGCIEPKERTCQTCRFGGAAKKPWCEFPSYWGKAPLCEGWLPNVSDFVFTVAWHRRNIFGKHCHIQTPRGSFNGRPFDCLPGEGVFVYQDPTGEPIYVSMSGDCQVQVVDNRRGKKS